VDLLNLKDSIKLLEDSTLPKIKNIFVQVWEEVNGDVNKFVDKIDGAKLKIEITLELSKKEIKNETSILNSPIPCHD
jgi:hypothetical protein